jgi:hypothetical protein
VKATQLEPDVIDWTPFRAGQMVRFAAVCPSCQVDVCTVIVKTSTLLQRFVLGLPQRRSTSSSDIRSSSSGSIANS